MFPVGGEEMFSSSWKSSRKATEISFWKPSGAGVRPSPISGSCIGDLPLVAATFRSIRQVGQEEVRADRRVGGASGGDRNVDFYRRAEGAAGRCDAGQTIQIAGDSTLAHPQDQGLGR